MECSNYSRPECLSKGCMYCTTFVCSYSCIPVFSSLWVLLWQHNGKGNGSCIMSRCRKESGFRHMTQIYFELVPEPVLLPYN